MRAKEKFISITVLIMGVVLLLSTCQNLLYKNPYGLEIISPKEGAILNKEGKVILRVSDASQIELIEIFIGERKLGELSTPPFEFTFQTKDIPGGKNTICVRALLKENKMIIKSVNVTIDNPPDVLILNPQNGMIISDQIFLQADVKDDFEVSKVEFYSIRESGEPKLIKSVTIPLNEYYIAEWNPETSGNYIILAKAYDNIGNVGESSINLVVDKDAPVVKILSPSAGEELNSKIVPIVVEVYDDYKKEDYSKSIIKNLNIFNSISKVEFFVNNQKLGEKKEEPYVFLWDTSEILPGNYTIKVRGYDLSNNFTENSVTVKLLKDFPTVSILQPEENSIISGIFTVRANARSAFGVRNVKFFLDDSYVGVDQTEPYEIIIDPKSYKQGEHIIKAEVTDNNGRSTIAQVKVLFRKFVICGDFGVTEGSFSDSYNWDNAVSEVFLQGWRVADWNDLQSYFSNGGDLAILFEVLGIQKGQQTWCKFNGLKNYSTNLYYFVERTDGSTLSEGVFITGLDNNIISLGASTGQKKVLAYRMNPLNEKYVRILSPQNNEYVFGTKKVTLGFKEGFKPIKVKLYLNRTPLTTILKEPFEYIFDSSTFSPGTYKLWALVEGDENTTHYDFVTIEIPNLSVSAPSLNNNSYLSGIVEVKLNVNDSKNLIDKIELYVDTKKEFEVRSAPYNLQIDTRRYSDGNHKLCIKCYLKNGADFENKIDVWFDNTTPILNILSPVQDSVVNGIFDIKVDATDNIGLSKIEVFVDDSKDSEVIIEKVPLDKNIKLDTTKYISGYHLLRLRAIDKAGNHTERIVRILVDQPPSIEITKPVSGQNLCGEIMISANVKDDIIVSNVSAFVDDKKIGERTTGPFEFSYNIGDELNTVHTIRIKATDTRNNISESSIKVNFWKLYQNFESLNWKSIFQDYEEGSTDLGKIPEIVEINGSNNIKTKVIRLGRISDSKEIWFSFNIRLNRNATLNFEYKVSSEPADIFEFSINGQVQNLPQKSGQSIWLNYMKSLSSGTYIFKFSYKKDVSSSLYDDCVYIDNLTVRYND